jgi:hypothetical protein
MPVALAMRKAAGYPPHGGEAAEIGVFLLASSMAK